MDDPDVGFEMGFKSARHLQAGLMLAILIIAIRVALIFQVGEVMFFPLLAIMIVVTRLSPPVSALFHLYGWPMFGAIDFSGLGIIPRIPTISVLTVWTVFWLLYWQLANGSLRRIEHLSVIKYIILIFLFFSIGLVGAWWNGYLSNPLVQLYSWDIVRGWLGYFVIAMLACRNLGDLKVMLVGLPFAFLIYPLSFPQEVWQGFFSSSLSSSSVLGVGLGYGSLNTNTLGQAAAVASVVAVAILVTAGPKLTLRVWMLGLFLVGATIVFLTSSRQSLVSLLVGLIFLSIARGKRRGIVLLLFWGLSAYLAVQILMSVLPAGSGFQTRLVELTQPPETWESQSFTARQADFEETIADWLEAPIFGSGFGGQRFDLIAWATQFSEEYSFALRGTHSLFLGILAQTGIVGFLIFVLFGLGIWRSFSRIRQRIPQNLLDDFQLTYVVVLAALACILVQQNVSGGLGVGSSMLIFLLGALLGATAAYSRKKLVEIGSTVHARPILDGR